MTLTESAIDRLASLAAAFVMAVVVTACAAALGWMTSGDPAHISIGFVFGLFFVSVYNDLRRNDR